MPIKQKLSAEERSEVEFLYFKGKLRSADIQALVSGFAGQRSNPLLSSRAQTKRIDGPEEANGIGDDSEEELELLADGEISSDAIASAPRAPRGSGPKRTYPTPDTVDIDLETGESPFAVFAAAKAPETHRERYLVAAEWLRANRSLTEITTGHVRTCYIRAGWDFDVVDPSQPFRKLKKEGLGTISEGRFTIKHLGTSEVNKMNSSAIP